MRGGNSHSACLCVNPRLSHAPAPSCGLLRRSGKRRVLRPTSRASQVVQFAPIEWAPSGAVFFPPPSREDVAAWKKDRMAETGITSDQSIKDNHAWDVGNGGARN